jgi:hypothetical protein
MALPHFTLLGRTLYMERRICFRNGFRTKYLQCLTDLPRGADSVGRMARKFRLQYPGAIYHVMSRGDQREAVFRDGEDRQKLLATLGEACRNRVACGCPPSCLGERFVTWKTWGGRPRPPLGPKDAWWGRWARIWGCLASAGVGQGGYFSDQKGSMRMSHSSPVV